MATSPTFRTYTLRCRVPPGADIARLTEAGCTCKKLWFTPEGKRCDTGCCNPSGDPNGPWCSVEEPYCQGADWGYCDSREDPIIAGSYPVCVRVLPSSASTVYEHEPCHHRFTYFRSPHVDSLSPRSGPITGGTNVTLTGRYFPQTRLGGLLCKFGDFISPGRWLSSAGIACVSPQSLGDNFGVRTVQVTISVNGGVDWTPSTASFSFVPELQGFLSPEFGPRRGGTLLEVHVPRRFGELEAALVNLSQVKSCCFGTPPVTIVPALRISDTHYRCTTPPWPQSPANVAVGVAQDDGRCQALPRARFSYVEQWLPTRVYPAELDEAQQAAGVKIFVSGERFRLAGGAMCRFGGTAMSPAQVLVSNYSLVCSLPTTGLNLRRTPNGTSLEVEVAMNGVDFAGGSPPVLLRFTLATAVHSVEPANISTLGNLALTVKGANLGADLRKCIFGEGERAVEVPLSALSSEREAICTAPHWEISPEGAAAERVLVRLAADGVGNARESTAYVTYFAHPEALIVEPNEGPVSGGTRVQVKGQNFRPDGMDLTIECVFGSKRSAALVINDTDLLCTSPALESLLVPTGYLSSFDLELLPKPPKLATSTPAATASPKKQMTFYYRRFLASISQAEPLSGPELGGTLVSLRLDHPFLNSQLLRCVFGNIPVPLFMVSANEATCVSPAMYKPGFVELTLTLDMQNRVQIGPMGSPMLFHYYLTPTVAKVTPSFGSARGGTLVQLEGAHFINNGRLTCKFGQVTVPAYLFISTALVLCKTPPMPAGLLHMFVCLFVCCCRCCCCCCCCC
ncbi:unnamed protein product [Polarella glacialis]|uniref:IPT/TIG domain-containing protein n=1 Tax=Polarella glacialis TaxID=89957 RepID=A0A813FGD8_POLGL|nr:unnamed protein product [Polarella glacialis]